MAILLLLEAMVFTYYMKCRLEIYKGLSEEKNKAKNNKKAIPK